MITAPIAAMAAIALPVAGAAGKLKPQPGNLGNVAVSAELLLSSEEEEAMSETGHIQTHFPGWASAVVESLVLSQQESEDSAVAEACRVDSSSETSDEDGCAPVSERSPGEKSGRVPLSPQSSDEAQN